MGSQNVPTGKKYNQFRIKLELGNIQNLSKTNQCVIKETTNKARR